MKEGFNTTDFEVQQETILGTPGVQLYYKNHFDLLSEMAKRELFTKSKVLVSYGFGQRQDSPEFEKDVLEFLRNGELHIATYNTDIIGLKLIQTWSVNNLSILYLAGTVFSPDWQGKGLNSKLTSWIINSHHIDVVSARTQNPNNYCMLQKVCSRIWPQENNPTPKHIQEIGLKIAQRIYKNTGNFDLNSFVDIGTYGSTLYDTIPHPKSQREHVNTMFSTLLNFSRGDSLLIIGEVSK